MRRRCVRGADEASLCVATAVLPNAVSVGLSGAGSSGAGAAGGATALAPIAAADYRMLSALMAAGGVFQPQLGQGGQGASQ